MFGRRRKGIGSMLTIAIFFIFFGISIFLFLTLFTYTIRVSKIQTIAKSRESLLFLSIINNKYSSGEDLATSLSNDTEKTNKEIEGIITNFAEIKLQMEGMTESQSQIPKSVYYYYKIGEAKKEIYYFSNNRCITEPTKCRDYTYIARFPMPQIYDGTNFVKEGLFISFV